MILTSGEELIAAITNLLIAIGSIIILLKIKDKKNKLWNIFYIFMIINSILGIIIHGLVMTTLTKKILWIILSFIFTLTINTIFYIFKNDNIKIKKIFILSIIIYSIFFIETILKIDFLNSFIIYAAIIGISCIYFIIKNNILNKKIFLFGFFLQLIGALILIFHFNIYIFNKNSLYHILMLFTLIIFAYGIPKTKIKPE